MIMTRTSLLPLMALTILLPAAEALASGPDPLGLWSRGDGNAHVRIERCGDQLCARNTWIRDPSGGEAVGDVLILDVSPQSGDVLKGTAHDPKRKLNYSMTISASKDKLDTRGCIVGGLICKTVSWTRLP